MIIRLFKAGQEVKEYNNFESMELQEILKDTSLDALSTKYNLEFYGNNEEILKELLNIVYSDSNEILLSMFNNHTKTIDNIRCFKLSLFAQIFELIIFKNMKCRIEFFDRRLMIIFKEISTEYYIKFI